MLKPDSKCTSIGGLWEVIRLWEWSPHTRDWYPKSSLINSIMWGYSKKTTVCEPGSRLLLDTESSSVLILGFLLPELVSNKSLLFVNHPVCAFRYSSLNGLRPPYYLWCNIQVKVSEVREIGVIKIYIWYKKSLETAWCPWVSESGQEDRKDWPGALLSLEVEMFRIPQQKRLRRKRKRGEQEAGVCACVLKSSEENISGLYPNLFPLAGFSPGQWLGMGFSWRRRKALRSQPWIPSCWPSCEDRDCCVMSSVCIWEREAGIRESALSCPLLEQQELCVWKCHLVNQGKTFLVLWTNSISYDLTPAVPIRCACQRMRICEEEDSQTSGSLKWLGHHYAWFSGEQRGDGVRPLRGGAKKQHWEITDKP